MIEEIQEDITLRKYITDSFFENSIGILFSTDVPKDKLVGIDIDEYYHKEVHPTPEIADLLITLELIDDCNYALIITEMKNIKKPCYFNVNNIYNKFYTVVYDFLSIRYTSIFCSERYNLKSLKLFFISDAYKLKKLGYSDSQIRSFLHGTKIEALQAMPPFVFKGCKAVIEYKLPNPLISWDLKISQCD